MRRALVASAVCLAASCARPDGAELVVASTTSTEDSGLLDVLIPAFERAHPGVVVKVIAVGSGEALALGRRADADVVLAHSAAAESLFMAEGYGASRRAVMANEFVVVGPASDPAGVRGLTDAASALRRIAASRAPFVSRGDASGTHAREQALWRAAGVRPSGPWYLEAGQGMGDVLRIASEKGAYALTDASTFLFLRHALALAPVVRGDERLLNSYSVITVAGAKNATGAETFASWLIGREAQGLIAGYGVERFGEPLFRPAAAGGGG